MVIDILLVAGGYLFGSISTAIVTCKLMGLPDPRTEGSGNPGATNVLRLGGKKAAFLLPDMHVKLANHKHTHTQPKPTPNPNEQVGWRLP